MAIEVETPEQPKKDRGESIDFATEAAFNALLKSAKDNGLALAPVMGLTYLPSEFITQQFKDACTAVLNSIILPDA